MGIHQQLSLVFKWFGYGHFFSQVLQSSCGSVVQHINWNHALLHKKRRVAPTNQGRFPLWTAKIFGLNVQLYSSKQRLITFFSKFELRSYFLSLASISITQYTAPFSIGFLGLPQTALTGLFVHSQPNYFPLLYRLLLHLSFCISSLYGFI